MVVPESVAVVGVGGLGCPASLVLAARGIRRLSLYDSDAVEVSNLHRQPWHHPEDVGRPKVDSAAEKLRALFPRLDVRSVRERLTATNAAQVLLEHDVVLDATDDAATKFLCSDAAVLTQKTMIYAGVLRFEGLAMRVEPQGPCLRCLFERPPENVQTCAEAGVLGTMAGVVGALQAELAFAPNPQPEMAWLHVVDGLDLSFRRVRVRKRDDCAACGAGRRPVLKMAEPTEGGVLICRVP
jgi:adenylyltransferase/sulfurtransferase